METKKKTKTREVSVETGKQLEFLKEYYVTRRDKFGVQNKKGETYHAKNRGSYRWLHDNNLISHLEGGETISVLAEEGCVKFFCMDFDTKETAKEDALEMVQLLKNEFRLENNEILVSFSGGKGYHVEIFFEEKQDSKAVYQFYLVLLDKTGKTKSEIEFRPVHNLLIKIPLGVNHKTGNRCNIVSNETMEEIAIDAIYSTKKISTNKMKAIYETISNHEFENEALTGINKKGQKAIKKGTGHTSSGFNGTVTIADAEEILEAGTLLAEGTRHHATLTLTTYLKEQGKSFDETLDIIEGIMVKTFEEKPELIDDAHTIESLMQITENRVAYNYERDYRLKWRNDEIRLNKKDIEYTFLVKEMVLRRLIFAFILHTKTYGTKEDGTLEFSLKSFAEMYGVDKNGDRLMKKIRKLELLGIVSVVSSNQLLPKEKWLTRINKDGKTEAIPTKMPNRYKFNLLLQDNIEDELFKDVTTKDYEEIVSKFIDYPTLRKNISKDQWQKMFRIHYTGGNENA